MIRRDQKLYDSVQIHTGIAANTEAEFFQQPLGSSPSQITTGTVATYQKSDYHSNNVLNGQLRKGQSMVVRGINIFADITDVNVLKQVLIDSKAVFQFWRAEEKVFQAPVYEMVDIKAVSISGFADASSTTKAQKFSVAFKGEPFMFKKWGITIEELQTLKAKIIFKSAVTFKSFTFDYGAAAANAAYTTEFNLFVSLDVEETLAG